MCSIFHFYSSLFILFPRYLPSSWTFYQLASFVYYRMLVYNQSMEHSSVLWGYLLGFSVNRSTHKCVPFWNSFLSSINHLLPLFLHALACKLFFCCKNDILFHFHIFDSDTSVTSYIILPITMTSNETGKSQSQPTASRPPTFVHSIQFTSYSLSHLYALSRNHRGVDSISFSYLSERWKLPLFCVNFQSSRSSRSMEDHAFVLFTSCVM